MDKTFNEWLKTVWLEDENRAIRKRQINETREVVKSAILAAIKETDGCKCDECILNIISHSSQNYLLPKLQLIGLEYVLGENFNGASALYYEAFMKELKGNG